MKNVVRIVIAAVILSLLIYAGIQVSKSYFSKQVKIVVTTEPVKRTNILWTISATGTVEPEDLINVGAQVNGKIMNFGKDASGKTIDYGSKVSKGMILAQIDDVTYKAELQEAQAAVEEAQADILSCEAEIRDAEAAELLAKRNWARAQELYGKKSMTKSDYDSYEASFYSTAALTAKSKASLAKAKASLSSAKASFSKAQRNLEYCIISSPVDGIVIDRRVSIGQTVVSNQTASSIFLVAKDFAQMEVWVSVNEADIGSITPGMNVVFFCDAFSGIQFRGKVHRVRYNATLSSNVVTYIVEVNADNRDYKLIPYLTANVKFIRDERTNVMSLPNTALNFKPDRIQMEALPPETANGETVLWKKGKDGLLKPLKVRLGLSNGQVTEIISDELREGDEIVSGTEVFTPGAENKQAQASENNPFTPNMPKMPSQGSAGKRERAEQRQEAK